MEKYDTYEVLLYGEWDWHKMEKEARLKCHKEAIKYMDDNYQQGEPYGYVPHNILQNFISACGGILALKKANPNEFVRCGKLDYDVFAYGKQLVQEVIKEKENQAHR